MSDDRDEALARGSHILRMNRIHETPLAREVLLDAKRSLVKLTLALYPDSGISPEDRAYVTGVLSGTSIKLCELLLDRTP